MTDPMEMLNEVLIHFDVYPIALEQVEVDDLVLYQNNARRVIAKGPNAIAFDGDPNIHSGIERLVKIVQKHVPCDTDPWSV